MKVCCKKSPIIDDAEEDYEQTTLSALKSKKKDESLLSKQEIKI